MSHPVKMFDVWSDRVNGKNVPRTTPLGTLAIEHERNKDRRKETARARAAAHVGREPLAVLHAEGDSIVVTFRRPEVPNAQ